MKNNVTNHQIITYTNPQNASPTLTPYAELSIEELDEIYGTQPGPIGHIGEIPPPGRELPPSPEQPGFWDRLACRVMDFVYGL